MFKILRMDPGRQRMPERAYPFARQAATNAINLTKNTLRHTER